MKISVLICAHTCDRQLERALAAVGEQSHPDWELLVALPAVDVRGQTPIEQFARSHATNRVERINASPMRAADRNRLLDLATGDAVAFLDPPDLWTPRHLTQAEQSLRTGSDVVVANARMHDAKTGAVLDEIAIPPELGTNPVRTLFTHDVIPTIACVVCRREVAISAGRFDEQFRSGEDRDLWLRCALKGARFTLTHRPTCHCVARAGERTRTLAAAASAAQLYEKHRDVTVLPAALRRRLLVSSLVAHGRLLRATDPNAAARCFWRAWSLQPVQVQTLGEFALTGWSHAGSGARVPEPPAE